MISGRLRSTATQEGTDPVLLVRVVGLEVDTVQVDLADVEPERIEQIVEVDDGPATPRDRPPEPKRGIMMWCRHEVAPLRAPVAFPLGRPWPEDCRFLMSVLDLDRPARPRNAGLERGGFTPLLFLPEFIGLVAGLLLFLPADPVVGLRLLVWVSCGYALYMVGSQGGAYICPSGVFFLASGVFVGLASHYLLQNGSVNDLHVLRDMAVVAFLTTVTTAIVIKGFSIVWKLQWPSMAAVRKRGTDSRSMRPPPQFQLRAVLMVALSQVPPVKSALGPVATGLGLAGVMMLVLSASSRRVRLRWHGEIVATLVALGIPLLWIRFEFHGGGRLTLAGLGVASLLLWNLVRPRTIQKVVIVLAIPVFLLYSGLNRSDDDSSGQGVVATGSGLASVYSPLDTWAELTQKNPDTPGASVGPTWGTTFLHTAVLPIPRALWPDKPPGFGSELTYILRIDSVRSGAISAENSMAALSQGEWYVDFGYPGLALMTLALGWFLAVLDRSHLRIVRSELSNPSTWWRAVCLACLVASLGDLYWVGTFTFFARGGLAAVVAWGMWRISTSRDRSAARSRIEARRFRSLRSSPAGGEGEALTNYSDLSVK